MRMSRRYGRVLKLDFSKPSWFEQACEMSDKDWKHLKRGERTSLLSDMLVDRVFQYPEPRVYWAREVTVNGIRTTVRNDEHDGNIYISHRDARVDFMRVDGAVIGSENPIGYADIDCFEVKSCVADLESGHGLNFIGTRNYVVCPPFLVNDVYSRVSSWVGVYSTVMESWSGVPHPAFKQVRHAVRREVGIETKAKMLLCMMRCNERDMLDYIEYDNPLIEYEKD